MKKINRRSFLKATGLLAAAAALTACGGASSTSSASGAAGNAAAGEGAAHAPITIMDGQRDYTDVMELVHAQYPEIQLEVEAYRGNNMSAYMSKQLRTGIMPDIYCTTQPWNAQWQQEHLLDLAQYPVSDQFNEVRINDTDVDGANYLLPYDFTIVALSYNKSLFERQGWDVPESFEALAALMPEIKAAGVTPAICQLNLPGFGFQYFCDFSDALFLNSVSGRQWQEDFLAGKVTATDTPDFQSCIDYFQQWIDVGVLNGDHPEMGKSDGVTLFSEGNTAFYVGGLSSYTQNDDGTGDEYALLPFLSPKGNDNEYVLQTARYYGLNKTLAEPGNEQKLEDALHFLEVLATRDGFDALLHNSATSLCSIKDFTVEADSPYHEALEEINNGHAAPMLYSGWESYIAPVGNAIIDWIKGESTGEAVLAKFDEIQEEVRKNGGAVSYANVTETLDEEQVTKLIAMMMLDQTDADAALVSRNVWKEGVNANHENNLGANGKMLPGALTEEDIVINLPTGWKNKFRAMTLTGARLKELAAYGYDFNGDGNPYPYLLLMRDGSEPEDAKEYTIVFCGATDEVQAEGSACDTDVVGLDAAKAYYQKLGTISPETVA